jgi:peptidyl-prolyl cis-trans isomerase D
MADTKKYKKAKTKKHLAREQREAKQTRVIITIAIIVGALILGLVGYGIIDQLIIRPRRPVAQVGDTVITVRDFESYVQYTRVQMLNQTFQYYTFYQQFGEFGESFLQTAQSIASELAQPVALGRGVLDEMVNNILIMEEAEKLGITASEDEIDQAIQAAFGFFPDGTPTPTVTVTIQPSPTYSETQMALVTLTSTPTPENDNEETELSPTNGNDNNTGDTDADEVPESDQEPQIAEPSPTPTITITPTPFTTEAFGEQIKEFNNQFSLYNFSIEDLREVFKVQILREKLIDEISLEIDPIRQEVWARHILVETEEEALMILSLLEDGEEFHDLAAEYSQDESNAARGGDLGWFAEETMVPEFAEVAFILDIGEISDPVTTSFGSHIIQVLGQRENPIPPNELQQQKLMAFNSWLSEQRNARDDIVIYEEWEKAVPNTPEIPQQLLVELFQQQQQQNIIPPTIP